MVLRHGQFKLNELTPMEDFIGCFFHMIHRNMKPLYNEETTPERLDSMLISMISTTLNALHGLANMVI